MADAPERIPSAQRTAVQAQRWQNRTWMLAGIASSHSNPTSPPQAAFQPLNPTRNLCVGLRRGALSPLSVALVALGANGGCAEDGQQKNTHLDIATTPTPAELPHKRKTLGIHFNLDFCKLRCCAGLGKAYSIACACTAVRLLSTETPPLTQNSTSEWFKAMLDQQTTDLHNMLVKSWLHVTFLTLPMSCKGPGKLHRRVARGCRQHGNCKIDSRFASAFILCRSHSQGHSS